MPTQADHVHGVRAPGKYDAIVGSEAEARRIVEQALPNARELDAAVAGLLYPNPPRGVISWFQVHPAEPEAGNVLPHIKHADWTLGKKCQAALGDICFSRRQNSEDDKTCQ